MIQAYRCSQEPTTHKSNGNENPLLWVGYDYTVLAESHCQNRQDKQVPGRSSLECHSLAWPLPHQNSSHEIFAPLNPFRKLSEPERSRLEYDSPPRILQQRQTTLRLLTARAMTCLG
jgi:hypothetical protein